MSMETGFPRMIAQLRNACSCGGQVHEGITDSPAVPGIYLQHVEGGTVSPQLCDSRDIAFPMQAVIYGTSNEEVAMLARQLRNCFAPGSDAVNELAEHDDIYNIIFEETEGRTLVDLDSGGQSWEGVQPFIVWFRESTTVTV